MEQTKPSSRQGRVISSRTGQPFECTAVEIVKDMRDGGKLISEIRQFPEELITALPERLTHNRPQASP